MDIEREQLIKLAFSEQLAGQCAHCTRTTDVIWVHHEAAVFTLCEGCLIDGCNHLIPLGNVHTTIEIDVCTN